MSQTPTDTDLLKIVNEAFEEAWDAIHSEEGWKEEKKHDNGDICMSRQNKKGKKMYRIKVTIDCSAEKLIKALETTKNITEWNTTLTDYQILKELDKNVKVSYQVTTEAGPGGVVSARDFIFISKYEKRGNNEWMQGGVSVEYPAPKSSKIVRAWNNPGGQHICPSSDSNKCEFVWLMDCEYNGLIPGPILEIAMPQAQFQFVECVRKLATSL